MKSRLFVLLLCAALFACGKKEAPREETKPAEPKALANAFVGKIHGVVRLAEGSELPKLADTKNGSQLAVVEPPAPCSPVGDEDLMPVRMGEGRVLKSMHVALTDMTKVPDTQPTTREIYLTDCRLTPSVVGAIRGDSLRVINRSGAALLPTLTGESFMQAILPNESRTLKLDKTGALRLACGFGAFCGRTDVLVTTHSLFAVTDARGAFTVENVPLDQEVTVHAWHPLFREGNVRVRLSASEPTKTVEIVVTPADLAPPQPSEPTKAEATPTKPSSEKPSSEKLRPL